MSFKMSSFEEESINYQDKYNLTKEKYIRKKNKCIQLHDKVQSLKQDHIDLLVMLQSAHPVG